MADVEVSNLDAYLAKAFDLMAHRIAEAIQNEILLRRENSSYTSTTALDQVSIEDYYRDETMPFYKGTLLRSMRIEPISGGYKVFIGAQYASDIEEGNVHTELVDGLFEEWVRDHRKNKRHGDEWEVGRAHPFVAPAIEHVLTHKLPSIVEGAFQDASL